MNECIKRYFGGRWPEHAIVDRDREVGTLTGADLEQNQKMEEWLASQT